LMDALTEMESQEKKLHHCFRSNGWISSEIAIRFISARFL